jgi:hypothetical protein
MMSIDRSFDVFRVPPWNRVKQWNTWNGNGTEIFLKYLVFPKIEQFPLASGLHPVNIRFFQNILIVRRRPAFPVPGSTAVAGAFWDCSRHYYHRIRSEKRRDDLRDLGD